MHNFYKVLGVNKDASTHVVKKAYRDKALSEHPDKGGDAQRMALLTAAYETLSDPIERKKFDQELEVFNASYDTEILLTPSGCLPTAGIAFSKSFRQQHAQFVKQGLQKPFDHQTKSYLKAFRSDLYFCNGNVVDDLFSFIKAKRDVATKLDIGLLTPEKAVEYFINFLRGDYSRDNLKCLSKAFRQQIEQLETSEQAGYELKLYCGIREMFLVVINEKPTSKILFSLHEITEYAKHNPDKSMSFMASLLQSKYFRSLYSQALHYYWLSEECVLDESYAKAFNGQAATKSLIERLKSQLSENRSARKSNDRVAKTLRYVRLLHNLEKDMNKRADITITNRAAFYREKAFHLLDWLPALMRLVDEAVTVNTLLRIGIALQKAAAQEQNSYLCMADEKLAAVIYVLAVDIGHHATPDVELYAGLHSVKCLLSCRYADSEFKEILEALQHRALWLADLFPFFQAPQSNADFITQEDKTLVLMRQLLHALIDKIDQKDSAKIDHSHVRVVYQAYEACLKDWYQENHDPEKERKFRQQLMQELLVNKKWTIDNVNYNLSAPWPFTDLDEQGWTCHESSILQSAKKANVPIYKTIRGAEFNYKTGEINFILDYCKDNESDYNRLLTPFDLKELLQCRLASAIFSLDPVDPDMPYHPFNQMRFVPSTLYHSQLLHTMLLTDYLLKFLTVGQEVQRRDPYELRSLDRIMSKLPDHLKKVIYDFHASNREESLHRFWIESEKVELAIDDEGLSKNGDVLFALGNIRMVIKHHKMKRDVEGNLVDKEGKDEGWDCYILTQEQKRELYDGKRIITDSALIIIKESGELMFWENHKATHSFTLEEDRWNLIRLSKLQRDDQEKIKTNDSESLRQIYRIVLKAAEKTGMPNRYSPEFIFAQEFTKNYDEFAIYFPEFGRLRELSKGASLVNVMAAQRAGNQEEINLIRGRLNYKQFCGLQSKQPRQRVKEHDYWETTRRKLEGLVREDINKQFEEWRSKFSKEKIEQKRQELLSDLRRQIGTLRFTSFSPEIREICDRYFDKIKSGIIAEHGYSGWNSVSHMVYKEAIEPQIPKFIADLKAHKKAACHEQLSKLFEDELAELSRLAANQLVDKFLEGNDNPLREHLVYYDRNVVAKQIKKCYPEHTIDRLDRALNHSLLAINEIINCETEKALEEYEKQLRLRLSEREKLEQSFTDLGFGDDTEEVNLEGTCSWVPASFWHDVKRGHSRTVYGGVCIEGLVNRIIDPKLVKALARQTRKDGKRVIENRIRGIALNKFCEELLRKLLSSDPRFKVVSGSESYIRTKYGGRYLDLLVLKDGIPVQGIEIKAADSPYVRPNSAEEELENKKPTIQGIKDDWTENERETEGKGKSFPIRLVRAEKLTKEFCKLQ